MKTDNREAELETREQARDRKFRKDNRFMAFLKNAQAGKESAIESLSVEYGIDFEREGGRFE